MHFVTDIAVRLSAEHRTFLDISADKTWAQSRGDRWLPQLRLALHTVLPEAKSVLPPAGNTTGLQVTFANFPGKYMKLTAAQLNDQLTELSASVPGSLVVTARRHESDPFRVYASLYAPLNNTMRELASAVDGVAHVSAAYDPADNFEGRVMVLFVPSAHMPDIRELETALRPAY